MDIENFTELLKKIERKYGWKNHMRQVAKNQREVRLFKYATFSLDTRDMQVWQINFHLGGEETSFNLDDKNSIKKMYKWLNSQN